MRIRALFIIAALIVAVPLLANETKIYSSYETVRQALLKNSLADVQKSAKNLATAARSEKQELIAVQAETLAEADDIASARRSVQQFQRRLLLTPAAAATPRTAAAAPA